MFNPCKFSDEGPLGRGKSRVFRELYVVTTPPGVGGGWRESHQELESHQRVTSAKRQWDQGNIRLYSRKRILKTQESGLKGRKKEARKNKVCLFSNFPQ